MPRPLTHHPRRYALTNELHARPFQPMEAPGRVAHLSFMLPEGAAERDPAADLAHLCALLDRHGSGHPAPGSSHHVAEFGRYRFTWERHTEFVSYTIWESGEADAFFAGRLVEMFPEDWLAEAPGNVIAATEIELAVVDAADAAKAAPDGPILKFFNLESLAVAQVFDGAGLALGDFRIDQEGFTRFAVVMHEHVGPRRIGRLVQRLIEIETYAIMAMLALPVARQAAVRLNEIENELTRLTDQVAHQKAGRPEESILEELTERAAELEALAAGTAFRFGAGRAYEAIVESRIQSLREVRVGGRQLFSEFMARRFDPAMRTCHAVERRLAELSTRSGRIAELLGTRVSFAVEAQNRQLLKSMDTRAALQLRLQQTVEGLSVVAISYYGVSLASYLLYPLAAEGFSKEAVTGLVAGPIVLIVFGMVRRTRRRLEN
ncbi:MAG: DUF3422 family protein [Pikeienuella sp.]